MTTPRPIALLNATVMPADGTWHRRTIPVADARQLIAGRDTVSHVGHDVAAVALARLLDRDVPPDRTPWAPVPGDEAIALTLNGRPPEGSILDLAAMDRIGYELVHLVYVCGPHDTGDAA